MKHLFIFCAVMLSAGCSTAGYYWQALNGHANILNAERPITDVLQDTSTRHELRHKLQQVQAIRRFAIHELKLPDNNSYTRYSDLKRPFALWNVVATPRFSIEPKQWCFLFVGCISYRGYYSKDDAISYAKLLKHQGYDVMVAGARAYSTLGWMDDPLLNTMLYKDSARLAGIIFHELAHQQMYKKGFSSFNEAFAMTVEYEGVVKWLTSKGNAAALAKYRKNFNYQLAFNQLLRTTREKLRQVYLLQINEAQKEKQKQAIFSQLRQDYVHLKQEWNGDTTYDGWMSQKMNNAFLALVGTYYDDIPYFQKLLAQNAGSFSRFYQAVDAMTDKQISSLPQIRTRLANRQ